MSDDLLGKLDLFRNGDVADNKNPIDIYIFHIRRM